MRTPLAFLMLSLALAVVACGRRGERCALCGMTIDPQSTWRADLVSPSGEVRHYDSPRCALRAWRSGQFDATSLRVVEYYERRWTDGGDVVFVLGSDVLGPMGADLVPVDPNHATKFASDHAAGRPVRLASITRELLDQMH